MKQTCLHCFREAPVGSLWCQENVCSVDDKPAILEYGESLGDIAIAKLVALLQTSAIYEAERGGEKVLLKVAHLGFEERLKRETNLLMQLQGRKIYHPALLKLLPAHAQADLKTYPYGKTVLKDRSMYFAVFEYAEGETLRGFLLKDPQPWYQHAGWLALGLADVVALMHQAQRLHLGLSPETVLVRYDKDYVPRPLLLDLGAVTSPENTYLNWRRSYVSPAYVAPELLQRDGGRVGAFSDVYGLSLILHEMLAGHPAYNFRLRSNEQVYHDVLNKPPSVMNRPDLKGIPEIVARGINRDYRRRQPNVLTMAREVQANLPPVPKEIKERRINWRTVGIVIAGVLAIAFLLVLALSLGQAAVA